MENNITTTGEPVTAQETGAKTITPNLPDGYCNGGFMDKEHNILKQEYINRYAKEIARMLVNGNPPMQAAFFKTNFLKEAKKHLRRNVSKEACQLCAQTMLLTAKKLTATHKAPQILRDMMLTLVPCVETDEDFHALYTHLDAIYTEMLDNENTLS